MSDPNLIYCFACPGCGELIALPRLSPLGLVGPSQFQCTGVWPIQFLCSGSASVVSVSSSSVHLATALSINQSQRKNLVWEISGDCRLENCGKRHSLYTYSAKDTDPISILQSFISMKPQVPCLGGHPAKFHRNHLTVSRLLAS